MKNWKTYVFSGNPDWLSEIKEEYGNKVTVSDDYNLLIQVKDKEDTIVATVHDKDHPMDTKGVETPFLFNEARHVNPGAIYSDIFEISVSELKNRLEDLDKVQEIMDDIRSDKYRLRYKGWFFSGGRGEDAQMFDILDSKGNVVGYVNLNDEGSEVGLNNFSFYNGGWYNRSSKPVEELIRSTVYDMLPKQDAEICQIITDKNGQLCFPADFDDISREDLLTGTYEMPFADEAVRKEMLLHG